MLLLVELRAKLPTSVESSADEQKHRGRSSGKESALLDFGPRNEILRPTPCAFADLFPQQIPLPLLYSVTRSPPDFTGTLHPILLRTRDFNVYELTFSAPEEADGVWESLKGLCSGVGAGGLPGLYAFFYGGQHDDKKGKGKAGWGIYEPEREFKRMGLGTRSKAWRSSAINSDYEVRPVSFLRGGFTAGTNS